VAPFPGKMSQLLQPLYALALRYWLTGSFSYCTKTAVIKRFAPGAFVLFALVVRGAPLERHMIVLDPGHSHAASVFAQGIPGLSDEVHVYAPPGAEVDAFLRSVSAFNQRPHNPTHWQIKSFIAPDFLKRMSLEPPGNIVVISGRNDRKINFILSSLRAGQNVLADKPWIIDSKDFPLLETALTLAEQRHLVAFDCMTERFNIAYRIQRELIRDPDVFGLPLPGTASDPAVVLQNLHSLVKFDRGKVNLRPSWFLDIRQQGEAMADVGTHLVDLEIWSLFPDRAIDYRRDVKILQATQSPIFLTRPQFERLTGEQTWPIFLQAAVRNDQLEYACNNSALFTIRGIYTTISDRWEYESVGALNDSYLVVYRGSHSTIRVRQSKLENYVAELDLIPNLETDASSLKSALERRLKRLSDMFPNLAAQIREREIRVVIPKEDRERGGSSFSQLVEQFLDYVRNPNELPRWEKPNILAKYYVTTAGVAMAQASTK
jgi:Putative oxidoreductase C terminal domain